MKKSLIFVLCIMSSLSLLGCNNEVQSNAQKETTNVSSNSEKQTDKQGEQKTEEVNKVEEVKPEKEEPKKVNEPFFTDVFEKASLGVTFETAEGFAKSTGYPYTAEKGGEDSISVIKIYKNANKQGDVVNLIFMYNNSLRKETLSTISYLIPDKKKEASIENLSDNNSSQYKNYTTHILGEQNKDVKNITDIANFLFN